MNYKIEQYHLKKKVWANQVKIEKYCTNLAVITTKVTNLAFGDVWGRLQCSIADVSSHVSLVLVIKRNVCKFWSRSIIHMKVEKTDWMQLKPTQAKTGALLFQAEYTSGDYKVLVAKITLVPLQYILDSIKAELTSGWHAKGCFAMLCFKSFYLFPFAAWGGGIAYLGAGSISSVECSVLMHQDNPLLACCEQILCFAMLRQCKETRSWKKLIMKKPVSECLPAHFSPSSFCSSNSICTDNC